MCSYIANSQGLPGGQYDNYERKPLNNTSEMRAMISANYKIISNDRFTINDLGIKASAFASENLTIGVEYFYLFDQSVAFTPVEGEPTAALRFDYYSLNTSYFISRSFLLTSLGLNIGFGQMSFTASQGSPILDDLTGDWVTVIEPVANIYIQMYKYIFLNVSAGYRIVNGVEYNDLENSDLSGFSSGIGLTYMF